jgi:SH3-like domain-containing protein
MAMLLVALLSVSVMMAVAPAAPARAADLPPNITGGGFIISDAEFFDGDAMTPAQAQAFLEARVPSCKATTGPTCLRNFTADLPAKAKDAYCGAIAAKKKVRASEIIVTVARACDISPKVILVMLQKEQGLVTSTKPSDWSYRASMGMNCPDTAPCSAASAGFVNQVYLGARQQQVYADNPTRYGYRAGQVNTVKWHPNSACGTSKVFIENQATANLYIYTPYRPNIAALAAGYATGDSCSSYGNRNFYNYYVQWFAPDATSNETGAPARVEACTVPPRADVVAASGTATVVSATTPARKAPTLVCAGSKTLAKGAALALTGRYGAWVRVKDAAGATFWLSGSAVRTSGGTPASGGQSCTLPAAASIRSAGGIVTVTVASLNARKAPSTTCDTGRTALGKSDNPRRTGIYGDWWRITHEGATYWIHSDYATVAAPESAISPAVAMRTTTAIPLRSAPRDDAAILRTVPSATTVTVTAKSGKWRKTTIGSQTGWLSSTRLTSAPATPTVEDAEGQVAVTPTITLSTTSAIPLRSAASLDGAELKTLAAGTFVEVSAEAGRWRLVTVVGGGRGWVSSRALEQRSWGTAVSPTITQRTVSSIPLRPAPSASTTPLTTVPLGTAVVVSASYGKWRFVTVAGRTGWVSGTQLESTLPGTAVSPTQKLKTASAIPLRPTPTTSNTPVTTLAKGTTVVVSRASGKWRYVTVGSRTGWVSSLQLTSVTTAPTPAPTSAVRTMKTKSAIPLRTGPSTTAKPVVTVAAGTKVVVTGEKGRWRQVTVGSRTGWMSGLQLAAASSTWQTTSSLNLRSGASTDADVVTVLPKGAGVVVKGVKGGWRQVTAGSRTGWVSADFLR